MGEMKTSLKKWQKELAHKKYLKRKAKRELIEKKPEKLSQRDLKDLMGMNRTTYVKHHGAWKNK